VVTVPSALLDAGHRRLFAAAQRAGTPVQLVGFGTEAKRYLHIVPDLARQFPELSIVLAHLGVTMPIDQLDQADAVTREVAALAAFDNVAVACTAVPQLAREPYPFLDLWPHLHRLIDAFGIQRLMWGSDYTVHADGLTYAQAADYMRASDQLTAVEKEWIMGRSLQRILGWPS
jgi:L-fuconolactonase